jgi:hypothetical protein
LGQLLLAAGRTDLASQVLAEGAQAAIEIGHTDLVEQFNVMLDQLNTGDEAE